MESWPHLWENVCCIAIPTGTKTTILPNVLVNAPTTHQNYMEIQCQRCVQVDVLLISMGMLITIYVFLLWTVLLISMVIILQIYVLVDAQQTRILLVRQIQKNVFKYVLKVYMRIVQPEDVLLLVRLDCLKIHLPNNVWLCVLLCPIYMLIQIPWYVRLLVQIISMLTMWVENVCRCVLLLLHTMPICRPKDAWLPAL